MTDTKHFWMLWKKGGIRPPVYQHETLESAESEATRLCELYPYEEFFVLETVGKLGPKNTGPRPEPVKKEPAKPEPVKIATAQPSKAEQLTPAVPKAPTTLAGIRKEKAATETR